jgi:hypothetical protein
LCDLVDAAKPLGQSEAQPVEQPAALGRGPELMELGFHALQETLVHRFFFLPAIRTAGQDERLLPVRPRYELDLDARLNFVPVLVRQILLEPPQQGLGCADPGAPGYEPPRCRRSLRLSSLTIPRSRTQMRSAFPYWSSMAWTIVSTVFESFVFPAKTS